MFSFQPFYLGGTLMKVSLGLPGLVSIETTVTRNLVRTDVAHEGEIELQTLLPALFVKPSGDLVLGQETPDGTWANNDEVQAFFKS